MQGAFLPSKRPADNIAVAKEVLQLMRKIKGKKKHCAVKLDVSRAYDTLSWSFLREGLLQYGFSKLVVQRLTDLCIFYLPLGVG